MKHPVNWIFAQLTPKVSLSPHPRSLTPLVLTIIMFLLLFPCFPSLAYLQLSCSLFFLSPANSFCSHFSVSSHLLAGWWAAGNTTAQIVPICCALFLSLQNVPCKIVSSFILTLTVLKKIFGVVRKQEIKIWDFPCTVPRIFKVRMWNRAAFRAGKSSWNCTEVGASGAYHVHTSAKIHF